MKRTYMILAGVLACAASAATVASAQPGTATVASAQPGAPTAHAGRAAVVKLGKTQLGSILVSSSGRTLYEFSRDHPKKSSCAAISGCPETWPALKTSGKPTAGAGVKASLLSSINLPGGGKQVSYAGHPLYLYSGDSGPRETLYIGVKQFGGTWDALNASGRAVK
jgi:predicted lipoprotein with Yx(FWY)xxD motif